MGVVLTAMEKYYSITEVSKIMARNERTIRRMIERGDIKAIQIPGRGRAGQEWRIPQSEVEKFGFRFEDEN